jgi:hypothetical protein
VKLQRQTVATTRSILSAGSLSGREWWKWDLNSVTLLKQK